MRYPMLSFNSGELSPLTDCRSDVDKYVSGCRTLENMIPRIYGPAERRPGTQYIDTTVDGARLIPFIYSNSIAYMILMENAKAYFYYDEAQVVDGAGDRLEVTSPYALADLSLIQYSQIADVMWMVHPSYPQQKLRRTSATAFTIDPITFTKGPFMTRNDLAQGDGVTMTPSVTTGTGTLTASSATFDADHVGALFSVTQPRVNTQVSGSKTYPATGVIDTTILVEGSWTFTTHGIWTGTIALQRSIDGSTWETVRQWTSDADRNIQLTDTEYEDGVYYRINVLSMSANTASGMTGVPSKVKAELTVNSSTQTGICRVTGYTSSTEVDISVVKDFASTDADLRWAEGCWSPYRGYPRTVTFHEERCIYAGTDYQPQTIWFSAVDDYENFAEGTDDDEAFSVTLACDSRSAILWIISAGSLLVGTSSGEWLIRSSSQDEPITPTNFNARQQTNHGSTTVAGIVAGDAVLFVDRVARKIREMTFQWETQQYAARDITAMAEHITSGGVLELVFQRNPDAIVWARRADGVLLSGVYEREANVIAWSRHTFDSASGAVFSIASIPNGTEDQLWQLIERTIDGASVYYVETHQPRDVSARDDLWFVDCGLSFTGADADGILSGLDHLEGETVAILVDGAVRRSATVQYGRVNTGGAVLRKAIVGLAYRYTLAPMRFDLSVEGTTKGTLKTFPEVVISFYNSLNAQYGRDTSHLLDIAWRTSEAYDSPPDLFTGDKVVTIDGGFSTEDEFVISGNDPTPCTVRAIVPRIQVSGR